MGPTATEVAEDEKKEIVADSDSTRAPSSDNGSSSGSPNASPFLRAVEPKAEVPPLTSPPESPVVASIVPADEAGEPPSPVALSRNALLAWRAVEQVSDDDDTS